jgi:crossover junction endonuclease EME1
MSKLPPHLSKLSHFNNDDSGSSSEDSLQIMPPVKPLQKKRIKKIAKTTLTSKTSLNFDSDSDEDDHLLKADSATFSTKPTTKPKASIARRKPLDGLESSEQARQRKKLEADERKRREKEERARKREAEKLVRERQKQREKETKAKNKELEKLQRGQQKQNEKESKKRQAEENFQANGKYAHKEIVVLLDASLYSNEELALVEALTEDFLLKPYPSALTCPKAIQWVRKDFLSGGAADAWEHLERKESGHYEHVDRVILVMQPEDFIPLLQRTDHEEDDDYPGLETFLTDLIARWQASWNTSDQPKLLLLLHRIPESLDRQWIDHRRRNKKDELPPPTESELHDAIQWLLVQFQVGCVLCPSIEMIQSTVHKMTRAICEAPYSHQVSELECIKKIKTQAVTSDRPLDRAKDTWLRQLQQVPRLSEVMARNVVRHYPTALSLWQAYQEGDEGRNSALLADILTGTSRQIKLSEALYRFMTCENPKDMIF